MHLFTFIRPNARQSFTLMFMGGGEWGLGESIVTSTNDLGRLSRIVLIKKIWIIKVRGSWDCTVCDAEMLNPLE